MKYSIIFDTNILNVVYADDREVSKFELPKSFYNVVDLIERLGLADDVSIVIPQIVWQELQVHFKTNYYNKYKSITKKLSNLKFPNLKFEFTDFEVNKDNDINEAYTITAKELEELCMYFINKYEKKINNLSVQVTFIPYPTDIVFKKIIEKSLSKFPPFEGKEKKSDKGFKDALIWESILEYKEKNRKLKLIFYCKDNLLTDKRLLQEYREKFNDELIVVNAEKDIKEKLFSIQSISSEYIKIEGVDLEDYEVLIKKMKENLFKQDLLELFKSQFNENGFILEDIISLIPNNIVSMEAETSAKRYSITIDSILLLNNINFLNDNPIEMKYELNIDVDIFKNFNINIVKIGEVTI